MGLYVFHIDPDNLLFFAGAEVAAVWFHYLKESMIDWHTRQFLPTRLAAQVATLSDTSAFASAMLVAETLKHFTRVDFAQQVLQVKGALAFKIGLMPMTIRDSRMPSTSF
jgi:hypothetical protein